LLTWEKRTRREKKKKNLFKFRQHACCRNDGLTRKKELRVRPEELFGGAIQVLLMIFRKPRIFMLPLSFFRDADDHIGACCIRTK
jgi:hypothetical protein